MLLKSAIRYILFRKAEQLGLFDIPVPIKPYVRDGKVIAGHVATRKKRIAPKGKQPDLFGVAEPQGEAVKLGRLGHFIERHGGYTRVHAMLQGYTDDQRNTLLDSMAKLAGKTQAAVMDFIQTGARHEPVKEDLFSAPAAQPAPAPSPDADAWTATGRTKPKDGDKVFTENPAMFGGVDYLHGTVKHGRVHIAGVASLLGDLPSDRQITKLTPRWTKVGETSPYMQDLAEQQREREADAAEFRESLRRHREAYQTDIAALSVGDTVDTGTEQHTITSIQPQRVETDDGRTYPIKDGKVGLKRVVGHDEGDTKTENGIEYRLQDGRWHRTTPEETGQYQYGMAYRPPGPGAVPKGEYRVSDHPAFRHGVISYDRPLTDEEIKQFELTPIGTLDDHAQRLIDKMGRYAGRYAENDAALEDFVTANQRNVGVWSTDDHQVLLDRVKAKLKPSEPEKPAFTPTHELPDGTQVIAHADEYESEEAYPIGGGGGNAPPAGGSGGNDDSEPPNPKPDDDPHWSHAENIKHGKDAIHDVAEQHSDVAHAMFREELGWVDFIYGDVGGPPNAKGKRKGAKGVAHIIEARMRKDGMTYQEAMHLLDNVVVTIDVGDISTSRYHDPTRNVYGTKAVVTFKGIEAVLIRDDGANAWLMTGYEKREADEELPSVDRGEGGVSAESTLAGPTTPRPGEGAEGKSSVVPEGKNDNPQEGERNAEGLVFHDGRWHRDDDPEARTAMIDDQLDAEEAQRLSPPEANPEPTPEPTRPDPLERLRAQIEAMGGKAQVAENLRMAFKDRLTRPQAEAVINELADATGLDRDTVLAEMGIKEVTRKPAGERTRPDTLSTGGEYTDDDPNSPNYRFRDTGYIGDSRKELAAESIREHARNGQRLRATDIDWQQIEQNPRQAKELITKSNLFGKVDWKALKANGMEPGAGFLVDRVYASIAPEPSADDAQARKDYAVGLETLRDRLESCKTPENVTEVLEELRGEYDGIIFNEREKAAYEQAEAIYREINTRRWDLKKEREVLSAAVTRISGRINELSWQNERRERRKWKRDPDIDRQIEELRPEQAAAMHALESWEAAHPEALDKYETKTRKDALGIEHVSMENTGDLVQQERAAFEVMQTIKAFSLSRNREENPLHRAWRLMGPKFLTVLKWRSGKNAFQGHVTSAKTGKIVDWSWAEKQHVTAPKATAGKVRFQLRVAENFSRVGGRPVEVNSTDELKRRFGLRDVQSGNWVLTDPESAAFHVQHAAEALSDLSDLMGIPEDKLFVNGRVALAFGARGTGNAGFGGASRAHYERIHRVINLTKMGGGGALAHELFHAIDNLAKEAETGQPGDSEDFITDNPDLLPDGPLKQAVRGLRSAMLDGDKRLWQTLKYSANDARLAKHNLDRAAPSKMAAAIKDASDLESALLAIDGFYPNGWASKRMEKQREEWRRIAAAWHDGMKPEGGKARARAGAPVSDFTYQAHLLDGGQYGKYWSTTREMAARAFQAWCEDRLSDQGRKNDYLSAFADNQYYKDPIFGDSKPFPEGRERERINAAIDDLVYALRESGTLRKAFELLAA